MTRAVLSRTTGLLDAWSANLWQACWQGGLVVLAIWAIHRLLPSMPARCQCWFWRVGMLKFVVVLLLLPPLLDVPLLPAPAVGMHVEAPLPVAGAVTVRQADQVHVSVVKSTEWSILPTILLYLWLIGVGYSFLRFLLAWNSARHLKKRSRIITDGPITEQLRVQTRFFSLRTTPTLIEVPGEGSPMLFGMFWPTIVIPAETCLRLNAQERAMVLGHELAHIHRGDLFWGLIASLVRSVFFFHPLVWLCERQLKLAQEIAADELAIAKQNHDPIGYGSLLVSVIGKFGSKKGSRPLVSTISLETAGPVHSLTRRLVAMSRISRTSRRVFVCSGVLLVAVVLLGLVPWQLVAAEPKEGDPQPLHDVGKEKMTLAEYEAITNSQNSLGQRLYRTDAQFYGIVISDDAKGETRVAGVNKHTGEWKWLEMSKNQILFDPIMGDDVAAFIQHGDPLSELIVYNVRLNKWSAFSLQDRVIDVIPCVGDRMVCYQLRDRVVAYSATKDAWGMLLTKATPAVGDYGVFVDTANGRYEFPDKSGAWAAVKSPTATSR